LATPPSKGLKSYAGMRMLFCFIDEWPLRPRT
jgi:hypothetical protein